MITQDPENNGFTMVCPGCNTTVYWGGDWWYSHGSITTPVCLALLTNHDRPSTKDPEEILQRTLEALNGA
jgi:hypothetical protein